MLEIGTLSYKGGWNGGTLLINNLPISSYNLTKDELFLEIKGKKYPCKLGVKTGSDYDHGHTYNWEVTDLIITTETLLSGIHDISVIDIIDKHESISLYTTDKLEE